MPTLDTPLSALGPVAKRRSAELADMGLRTVRDMLFHFPSRHEDCRSGAPIAEAVPGTTVSVVAQVVKAKSRPRFGRRMALTEAVLTDGSAEIKAVWFNQPYRAKSLVPGKSFRFTGKVTSSRFGVQLQNPQVEAAEPAAGAHGELDLLPVYPTTVGVSQAVLRRLARLSLPAAAAVADPLPAEMVASRGLLPLAQAVATVHFPADVAEAAAARRRLAFDEVLRIQLSVGRMRRLREARPAPTVSFDEAATKAFVGALPFRLTDDQRRAAWAALQDMATGRQMHRLLDGDVGSGKTVVAAIAMMNAARNGCQSALMAPTEILACQHFATLSRLYADQPFTVALWTNAYKRAARGGEEIVCASKQEAKRLGADIADGSVAVVVGTHALVEETLRFRALALAVVDEQHRFGVRLRKLLCGKSGMPGVEPHLLSMTATPIPRSLALTLFGDLDLSVLKEKPKGRQDIVTKLVPRKERGEAYAAVREEIAAGRQAFVVCPLIDPSDALGAASVTEEYEGLRRKELKGVPMGMLHGKLSAAEKEKVMDDFLARRIMVLVSTSVVEVGVDVPNATVMCIEGAERFGLSQLHQFRGRIGRGEHRSFCFLLPGSLTAAVKERLAAVVRHKDGFALAEKDLELRGPGDLLGTAQSGFPEFMSAALGDMAVIASAREAAAEILAADPELTRHAGLRQALRAEVEEAHLE
ncbi:MAG TPA: ATP-dependent DNA helicase RecG [Patescibacteria group bacterium]|nr:ATP-dependent DNA helicase RecG [Patescibacteria group bacterium]